MLHAEYPRDVPRADAIDITKLREPKNAALRASATEQLAILMTDDSLLTDRRMFMSHLANLNARVLGLPADVVRAVASAR